MTEFASFAVVGHRQRIKAAAQLAHSIGATISWDDGAKGAEANHLEAWKLTAATESRWAVVLEDDAEPVQGFLEQAHQALNSAPGPVVSLYLGTSRPPRWQNRIDDAIEHAARTGAHWITGPHAIHALAIAIHSDLRDDWVGFAHTNELPIDERMSAWCVSRGHRVAYTWPSLVNHADMPTLIQHRDGLPRTEPRRAWRTGTRDIWNSKAVEL